MSPSIHLLTGAVKSGKTTALLQKARIALVNRELAGVSRILWICPDHEAATVARDSLLGKQNQAFLGFKICTFSSFAESVVAAGTRRIRPISQLQKRRLLQVATEDSLADGCTSHYAQVAKTPGFLSQVSELVAELKRRDVWPEHLQARCREPRENELAEIYGRYQQYLLDHHLYDAEGRFWAARELLAEVESQATQPEYSLVVVDGFADFTSAQYDILRHLGNRTAEMWLSLTREELADREIAQLSGRTLLFSKTSETQQRLQSIFPNLNIEKHKTAPQFEAAGIEHLASYLFCEPSDIAIGTPDTTGLQILAASSVQQECEQVAQNIKRLLISNAAQPQEIAVVYRSLEDIAPRISETLSDHGIPFALDTQTRLVTTPLFRSLLSLLRLQAEDWPFRVLLDVVGNRIFTSIGDCEESAIETDLRAIIERCVRRAQIPSGKQALFDQLKRWIDIADSASSQARQLAHEAGDCLWKLQQVSETLEHLPKKAMLSKWVQQVQVVLDAFGVLPSEEDLANSKASFNQSTWQTLKRGLQAIESLDSQVQPDNRKLSLYDFLELLETVARDQRLASDNDSIGCVRVLSAESARHIEVKHLFLAGLGEQSFASVAQGNPLFDVRRFEAQGAESGEGDVSNDSLNNESMQLFYELVTRASHKLTLSYPAMDAKGQPLSPSPLLVELKRCFGTVQVEEQRASLGDFVNLQEEPLGLTSLRQQAVAYAIEGKPRWLAGMTHESHQVNTAKAILDGIGCIAERSRREEFGSYDGLLEGEVVRKVLAQRFDSQHLWSASQLENYANCPFRFFGEQLLSLQPPEELALRSDALRRGSLLHQVLATLHQNIESGHFANLSNAEAAADLVKRFCNSLQQAIDATPLFGLQEALREIERREIEALAPQYAQQEIDYRGQWGQLDSPPEPQHFEVRFGPKSQAAEDLQDSDSTALPFELDLGDEKILLTGQIDRVDVGQVSGVTVFNIIDYKSGKEVRLQAEKVRSGQQLQLPLYAMAAESLLLVEQNAIALATGYWSIAGKGFQSGRSGALEVRKIEGRELQTSQQWDELKPELLDRVRHIVHDIRAGYFPVYNTDENCTRSCNLATICRIAQVRSLEKHWDSEEASSNE